MSETCEACEIHTSQGLLAPPDWPFDEVDPNEIRETWDQHHALIARLRAELAEFRRICSESWLKDGPEEPQDWVSYNRLRDLSVAAPKKEEP